MLQRKSTSIPLENRPNHRIIGRLTVSFDQLDSTNDLATRWIAKSKPIDGTVITAQYQQQGRGQIGREWFGSPGQNLAYTAIMYPEHITAEMALHCLMALSVSVLRAVQEVFRLDHLSLKWPNDLYWRDKKLGGMLIQSSLSGRNVQHLIFGVGINVNEREFPAQLQNPVSLLQILGRQSDPGTLILTLNEQLDQAYQWIRNGAWQKIMEEYHAVLFGKGQRRSFVDLRTGETFSGEVSGVDESGRLCVDTDAGSKYFNMRELKWL